MNALSHNSLQFAHLFAYRGPQERNRDQLLLIFTGALVWKKYADYLKICTPQYSNRQVHHKQNQAHRASELAKMTYMTTAPTGANFVFLVL